MSDPPKAIPTVYKGVQFRSRLETRWAALMDELGIFWDYEPELNLRGYIPDFLCRFGNERAILECKPVSAHEDFKAPQAKVGRSGWRGPVIIVGGTLELGADDKPDILARGCLACRPRYARWYPVGRACWPPAWGAQPFGTSGDLLAAWRRAGTATQWNSPAGQG